MKYRAFTLIELLMVVGILIMLTAVVIWDFRGVRQFQALNNAVQEVDGLLQQVRAETRAGKATADWEWVCQGAYLAVGEPVQKLEGVLDSESGNCEERVRNVYGLTGAGVNLQKILVGEAPMNDLTLWFVPTEGEALLDGVLELTFASSSNNENFKVYSFDPQL